MTITRTALFTFLALALSCTSSGTTSTTPPAGTQEPPTTPPNPDDGIPPGISDKALKVVIPKHAVPPGDSFECHYTDITTDRELFVNRSTGRQGEGGHHITIYYVSEAPQPVGHRPCIDAEMAAWRQVGAASDDAAGSEGVIDLPPGIAVKVPAGKQIVVQTHYINPTASPKTVEDEITVHLIPKNEVKRFAQGFAVVDGTFEIPPQGNYSRTSTCTVQRDLDLIMLLGHMHAAGQHYKLEHLDASGAPKKTLIDHDWQPAYAAHPPTSRFAPEAPLKLAKGDKLRQTCTWKNTGTDKLLFPTEMCIAFSMYLDDHGFLQCSAEP
jgi:hypothetical protein